MHSLPALAQPRYLDRLDAVRGAAILWVMVFHVCGAIWGWDVSAWPARFADWPDWQRLPARVFAHFAGRGNLGVPIFFVLSGFLIHLTWSRSTNKDIRLFWWRRWSRIVPPYLVALFFFTWWFDTLAGRRGWNHFLAHLMLVHNYSDKTFYSINGSFWSLAVEAQFYLLYPLLWRLKQAVGMRPLLLGALGLRLAFSAALLMLPNGLADHPAITNCVPRLYFEWILGMYVADCLVHQRPAFAGGVWIGWASLAFALCAPRSLPWEAGVVPAISLATAIWIDRIACQSRPASWLESPLLPFGVASYSLYLWHQPIMNEVTWRVMKDPRLVEHLSEGHRRLLATVLAMIPAIAVGTAMYWLIEVPSNQWGRRMANWFFPPTSPVVPASTASEFPRKAA